MTATSDESALADWLRRLHRALTHEEVDSAGAFGSRGVGIVVTEYEETLGAWPRATAAALEASEARFRAEWGAIAEARFPDRCGKGPRRR